MQSMLLGRRFYFLTSNRDPVIGEHIDTIRDASNKIATLLEFFKK